MQKHIYIDRKDILANRFIQSEQKIYIYIYLFMKEIDRYLYLIKEESIGIQK